MDTQSRGVKLLFETIDAPKCAKDLFLQLAVPEDPAIGLPDILSGSEVLPKESGFM